MRTAIFLLALVSSLSLATNSFADDSVEAQEIRERSAEYSRAIESGVSTAWLELLEDGFRGNGWGFGSGLRTKDEVAGMIGDKGGLKVNKYEFETTEIRVLGNAAIEEGKRSASGTNLGLTFMAKGTATRVWIRQGDTWVLCREIY